MKKKYFGKEVRLKQATIKPRKPPKILPTLAT